MKLSFLSTLFLISVRLLAAPPTSAPPHTVAAKGSAVPQRRQEPVCTGVGREADRLLRVYEKLGRFSGTVLIAKDGRILLRKSYGKTGVETKFRIASLTKQFTAVALLQLQEQGKLKLDDPISTWFPEYKAGEKITVRQLLNQTSGIPDVLPLTVDDPILTARNPIQKLLQTISKKNLDFVPGKGAEYSNTNYALLGELIQRVLAQDAKSPIKTYQEYVRTHLLEKAGMKDSGVFSPTQRPPGIAEGYSLDRDANWVESGDGADHSLLPAYGALYSTVDDLYRWDRALYGGKLLSQASLREMSDPSPHGDGYALGVVVEKRENGNRNIQHSGRFAGFLSQLHTFVDDNATIVLLSNNDGIPDNQIATDLGSILFCKPIVTPTRRTEMVGGSARDLDRFAGTYRFEDKEEVVLRVDEGKLYYQVGEKEETRLYRESATTFFSKAGDEHFTFDFRQGTASFVLRDLGTRAKATRVNPLARDWKNAGGKLDHAGNPIIVAGVTHPRPVVLGGIYNINGRLWRATAGGSYQPFP